MEGPRPSLAREEMQALGGLVAILAVTASWWALALWPVGDAPAWLARTRYVCFGVAETGLPDAAGWGGLVAGPGGMLAILLVGFWGGFRGLLARARWSVPTRGVLAALLLGFLLLPGGAALRVWSVAAATAADSAAGGLPPESYPRLDRAAPPLALTAHDGSTFGWEQTAGTPTLVTFAYGHCVTVCPVVVHDALVARERLAAEGVRVAVVVITLDPWRDTPTRLPDLARSWGLPAEGAWLLGGSVAEVEAALDAWEVPRSREPTTGMITHPALTYVVDGSGRVMFAAAGGADALTVLVGRL
ncbi:MAG: SCO family protein [Gemmatimonadota bacterium]